jgi:uncharacterized damage-inducible protein DinB
MTAKDVIKYVIKQCRFITREYINDLSDADLLVRPTPGANHIAWQLGHLLAADGFMLSALGCPAAPLPDGFEAAYATETATSDDPRKFHKKAEYLALMERTEAAALAAVDALPDADLDKPGPDSMKDYAPTRGAVLALIGTHWLMHAGQFVPVRRKLGRKPLF